jgi:hypothetical protein
MAGASARTLARLFRRETGMSFQEWRRQLRLTEGLAALSEGETPARVAAAVGYAMLEKRSAGVAKLLIDATAALGRKRWWSRVEVDAPHQPTWERSLKFYVGTGFVGSVHGSNSCCKCQPEPAN